MINDDEINIKIELLKDKNTGKLSIAVRFDTKASNISFENNQCIWIPTLAEKDLLNDAFRLVYKTNSNLDFQTKTVKETREIKEIDQPNKKEDIVQEENSEDDEIGTIGETGEIIEETIEKHAKKEEPLKEADEHTIIDRVLSQKKKGKWRKIE